MPLRAILGPSERSKNIAGAATSNHKKVETTHGERYLISSGSVDRHIGLGAQTRPLTPRHLDLDVDVAARGVRVGTDFFVRLFREFRELGLR